MAEIQFRGKEVVFNHHLSVPYRPLLPNAEKGVGPVDLAGNLVIHGDNLDALKALLPTHAGRVDLVFIDPPYNTGNEGWAYNDAVNSPAMKAWLGRVVDRDDLLRHDKWLCMMWPRLRLLRELLSERGSLWMTLDDNEVHRARAMLDEVFGEQNFVATVIWHKADSPKPSAKYFSTDQDYLLVYAKEKEGWSVGSTERTPTMLARYQNPDNDPRGPWMVSDLDARNYYSKGTYPITTPKGRVIPGPPPGRYWAVSRERFEELVADNRIWWGKEGEGEPNVKRFLNEVREGVVPRTLWHWSEVGSTRHSKSEVVTIFGKTDLPKEIGASDDDESVFITPKPVRLVQRVIELATTPDSLVLDSFAGSATTGHAVLAANAKDGGNRRFVLVETEDYADNLTAERLRRVIGGYAYTGTKREELLSRRLTFRDLSRAPDILAEVAALEADPLAGTRVEKALKDGTLTVTRVTPVEERVPGLGGGFTYCILGERMDLDALFASGSLPAWESLGAWLFHTATGQALDPATADPATGRLGAAGGWTAWLLYRPDRAWLETGDAALTLSWAKGLPPPEPGTRHLIFAAVSTVPRAALDGLGIAHAPLPYALFRVEQPAA
ncbi:site-specific DNA-methyltransferase (plasmid) [Roseomonas sp. CCTCC AB2023176]|uniref:site-specific DNA-methyltransferase n=1 Tax=Roseomonas sp. CCTCC AB2023176 TaxID=3342640 RepID=UPI0035DCA3BB